MFSCKSFAFILFLLFFFKRTNAQDDVLINKLLADISSMQVKDGDKNFFTGTFPSYRECAGIPHNNQPDYNIFFTAEIAFILRNILPELSGDNKLIAEDIIKKAMASYKYYQNKSGLPFYTFWPTGKDVLPHSFWWHHFSKTFNRGDDADDTVLMLMSLNASDSVCRIVKQRMIEMSNRKGNITTTYKKYKDIPAYSTWLGTNTPPDFDFAVQCNIMYFIYDRKLSFTKQDSATIEVLKQMVKDRKYLKAPVFISPYYVTTPILLYHLGRLMGRFHIPALEIYKQQIIDDIRREIANAGNIMDRIILSTSLMRLGEKADLDITEKEISAIGKEKFAFCQARAAYNFPAPLKHIFLHSHYLTYKFYSEACNETLLLEYLLEKKKRN